MMLTAAGCAARRRRLWDALPEPCDLLILADPQSLIYFANYFPSPFVFRSCDAGAVLILRPDHATLVSDSMVKTYLDEAHVDEVVAPVWYDGKHSAPNRKTQLLFTALDALRSTPTTRLGLETTAVPAGLVWKLAERDGIGGVTGLEAAVRKLRRAKDTDEVDLIRQSVRAGEAGHVAAMECVRAGMTELEVFLIVQEAACEELNAQVLVYGDFATGPRCATDRGGPPTTREIEAGDLCLLDFSVVVRGYRADFTNTFTVGGAPTSRQRELFAACLGAMEAGEAQLRPGTPARDVDAAVRRHLASLGLEHAFPSHTGHGLGLSHPEPPYLVRESDETVEAGDVVAIEPGLYIPGEGGMRFERNYFITPTGYECLTNHRLSLDAE